MKPDTRRMVEAYLDVFREFAEIWREGYIEHPETEYAEAATLFQVALSDPTLGEIIKQEIFDRYLELKAREAEQDAQPAEAEAHA